jgi:hypothetical protein
MALFDGRVIGIEIDMQDDAPRSLDLLHRPAFAGRRLLSLLALALIQFDQLLNGGGILRLLVCLPEGEQPWEAQRITRLVSDFSCRVGGRARDLVGQDLDDELRFDPHAGLDQRGDAGRLVIDLQSPGALAEVLSTWQ